jgi:hypothetical protein
MDARSIRVTSVVNAAMTEVAEPAASSRFGVSLPLVVGLVVFVATLGWAKHLLYDPDVYVHVAVGRWIIAHHAVPHYDLFSYSMRGAPWVLHEWLAEVVMALLHDWLGWAGLVLMAAFCFAAAAALLQRALMNYLGPAHALIGTAMAAGLCFTHLLARPHAFSLPLMVAWVAMLVAAAARRRSPPLIGCLLMALWANLHSGYIIGLMIAALFAAEAVFDAPGRRTAIRAARDWAIFGVLAVLASLATPNGIAGLTLPFDLIRMNFGLSYIAEWQSPNFQLANPLEPWLMLVLLGALTLGIRAPVTRVAILFVLLHMTLQHQRLAEVLGLVAPLLFAPSLAPQVNRYPVPWLDHWLAGLAKRASAGGVALAGVAFLALSAAAVRIGVDNDEGAFAPRTALAAATANHAAGQVFNDINFGDYLIYSGVAAPFIDGRIDMYGDTLLKRYAAAGEFPKLVAEYGIGWAVLTPNNSHVPLLDNLPGWRRIYADKIAVVYLREAGLSAR